ncbi:MAG: hypothetical protein K6A69_09475 [Lachnospiraceae bacterium]|nr:hypothetical protein [Lachnospiraceae bacterium]
MIKKIRTGPEKIIIPVFILAAVILSMLFTKSTGVASAEGDSERSASETPAQEKQDSGYPELRREEHMCDIKGMREITKDEKRLERTFAVEDERYQSDAYDNRPDAGSATTGYDTKDSAKADEQTAEQRPSSYYEEIITEKEALPHEHAWVTKEAVTAEEPVYENRTVTNERVHAATPVYNTEPMEVDGILYEPGYYVVEERPEYTETVTEEYREIVGTRTVIISPAYTYCSICGEAAP